MHATGIVAYRYALTYPPPHYLAITLPHASCRIAFDQLFLECAPQTDCLQNDPVTPATDKDDMKFDDIDLNGDKNAPKLDLDFGAGGSGASDKKSAGFSFGGGWGGGWGSTGNSWGFSGIEDDSIKKTAPADDNNWTFGKDKNDKKDKKKNNGFDFDFDSLAGEDDLGLSKTKTKDDKAAEEDPW